MYTTEWNSIHSSYKSWNGMMSCYRSSLLVSITHEWPAKSQRMSKFSNYH